MLQSWIQIELHSYAYLKISGLPASPPDTFIFQVPAMMALSVVVWLQEISTAQMSSKAEDLDKILLQALFYYSTNSLLFNFVLPVGKVWNVPLNGGVQLQQLYNDGIL